eukprot:gene11635-biopygen9433
MDTGNADSAEQIPPDEAKVFAERPAFSTQDPLGMGCWNGRREGPGVVARVPRTLARVPDRTRGDPPGTRESSRHVQSRTNKRRREGFATLCANLHSSVYTFLSCQDFLPKGGFAANSSAPPSPVKLVDTLAQSVGQGQWRNFSRNIHLWGWCGGAD